MQIKNLIIIGTSHIAVQSSKEVEDKIGEFKPDIVAVELDRQRADALLNDNRRGPKLSDARRIGFKGYLFALIGQWAEKKLGQQVGIMPGAEMKKAIDVARKKGIQIALIDDDIEKILRKFSKALSWREKWHFVADIAKAVFKRERIEFDLRKVPPEEIIKKMLKMVKKRYPNIYRVLIIDRNRIMAERLIALMEKNPEKKILAVVGAGHVEGMMRMIRNA